MASKVSAADCMVKDVITTTPEASISDVISILVKNKISGMPVVDAQNRVVGIISEVDCLKPYVQSKFHEMPSPHVKDVMSTNIISLSPDEDILTIAGRFVNSPFRRFTVVKDGKLIGQVSRRDIIGVLDK